MQSLSPLPFASPDVISKMASANTYTFLFLTKGPNYGLSDCPRIIQSKVLPYIFCDRKEYELFLAMPVMDNKSEIAAIAVYPTHKLPELKRLLEIDPPIVAGVFSFQLMLCMGFAGDGLPKEAVKRPKKAVRRPKKAVKRHKKAVKRPKEYTSIPNDKQRDLLVRMRGVKLDSFRVVYGRHGRMLRRKRANRR